MKDWGVWGRVGGRVRKWQRVEFLHGGWSYSGTVELGG